MNIETTETYQDDERPDVTERWQISNKEDLDWALEKIAMARREVEERAALDVAAIARIQARAAKEVAKHERAIRFFEAHVRRFVEANRSAILGKKKSQAFPHGVVGFRMKPEGLRVLDSKALLDWCRAQPPESDVLRIKEEPALSVIKEHMKRTGEVPSGAEVEPASETFFLKEEE